MALKIVAWWRLRRGKVYRWLHVIVPALLLLVAVWMRISGWSWVELVQNRVFDSFQSLRPRPYESVPVRVIDLDDESLKRLGQWPWPRTLVARLVRRLADLGASVVAFDVVFAEPDRTSPARVSELWPDGPGMTYVRARLAEFPDHDKVLAQAMAKVRAVMGFALVTEDNGAVPAVKAEFSYAGDGPLAHLRRYRGAVASLPVLEAAAAGNGSLSFIPDADGIVRRAPLLLRLNQSLRPSLSAEALRVAQGATTYAVKSSGASGETAYGGAHTGISKIKIGQFVVPTDEEGRLWVYYTEPVPERVIPAWKVFEGGFDRAALDGAIAYVGTSAAGLKDLRATPLNPAAAGVEVHANATEQVLLGRFLRRPDWAAGAELIYMVVLGLGLLFLLPRLGAGWCAPVGLAGIAAAFVFSWRAFTRWSYLVDPLFPSLGVFLVYLSSSLISYLKSEAERRHIKGAFSRYMSPAQVELVSKHPERLQLGGESREMTFHFCDIRGFTTISEQFDPHGLTQFINRFLTPMTQIVLDHQGTIDKYMGDCIMAFWNAPMDDPDHARHACRAALGMHEKLRELNEEWRAEAEAQGKRYVPIHIGTGLNTGPCVVGNMGSDQRFDYSVLGDAVNLASRLEGQSKTYGVNVVAGPGTREKAPEFAFLELDLIKVKGKTVPVRIFTLFGDAAMRESPAFQGLADAHGRMLAAYRGREWDKALGLIEEIRAAEPRLEVLCDLYEGRVSAFQAHPPAADWDGTFTATSK